jgi:Mn2+/Fe2+ NRAMP family transporter
MLNACVAGFTLLCFVLGLLISHPQTPVNMDVMFPKLSGESAYSLMALLGANIIAHSFYTQSSFVQVSSKSLTNAYVQFSDGTYIWCLNFVKLISH